MSDKIKLSELVAARDVARGQWEVRRLPAEEIPVCTAFPSGYYRAPETLVYDDGDSFVRSSDDGQPAGWDDAYAEYVVKMHNAADVLIEIAQAALEWRRFITDDEASYKDQDRACQTLHDLLDKVAP